MIKGFTELTGKEEGETSTILVGVHGDETCGVEVLEKILPNLQIEKGRVFLGYGNPRAIEANRRFMEANLNRMFKNEHLLSEEEKKSYEYGRAQFLKNYLNQSGALLDVHASFTPESKPFIIGEANAKEIIRYMPVDLIVSGFDNVEPGGTDYYMNSIGKIGICVECGYLNDPKSAEVAEKSMYAFLRARGHISNDLTPKEQMYVRMYDLYITKTDNFVLAKPFKDFEEILKGQVIGIDGREEVRAQKDGIILFARNRKKFGDEAFLFGEKKNSLA